jgi:hypothetical protein
LYGKSKRHLQSSEDPHSSSDLDSTSINIRSYSLSPLERENFNNYENKNNYNNNNNFNENKNFNNFNNDFYKSWTQPPVYQQLPPTINAINQQKIQTPFQIYQPFSTFSIFHRYTMPQPTQPPPTPISPSLCTDGRFDAITTLSDGHTYVFKGDYVFKMDSNFVMDSDYPKLINSVFGRWEGISWMSLPSNLDTVLYVPDNGLTYYFKDNFYWRSSKLYELDAGYPRIISENFKGLNPNNGFRGKLDASFVWSGNRRVYFIYDNMYWRYDFNMGMIEPGYPKKLSIWRGLPSRITDAFLWANGITYFFSDEKYYRFNDLSFKVEEASPSYPRLNIDYWFGCNTNLNRLGKLILNSTVYVNLEPNSKSLEQQQEYETVQPREPLGYNYRLVNKNNPTTTLQMLITMSIEEEKNKIKPESTTIAPIDSSEQTAARLDLRNKVDNVLSTEYTSSANHFKFALSIVKLIMISILKISVYEWLQCL